MILFGCNKEQSYIQKAFNLQNEEDKTIQYVDRKPVFVIDNDIWMTEFFNMEYSYDELELFFYDVNLAFKKFDDFFAKEYCDMLDIHEHFKIDCLRSTVVNGEKKYYIVYKVKEGGYYYVFLDKSDKYDETKDLTENLVVYYSYYVNELNDISMFDSIKEGESLFSEVYDIDEKVLLKEEDGKYYSYSLIKDQQLLRIEHHIQPNKNFYYRNLIAGKKEVVPIEGSGTYFEWISEKDRYFWK